MSATIENPTTAAPATGYFKNPWRKPRVLQGVTIGYLLWSLLPVVIAVIFSFNSGRSRISWQGFSLRWWTQDPTDSLLHDAAMRAAMAQTYKLAFLTVLVVVPLGTLFAIGIAAQLLGLISFQLSYPVIIVRARLLSIGPEYEEAAMDLGAKPGQAIRRVLLPLISPAILASVALVFADVVDDFVTVAALSAEAGSETLAMKIYSASRASPTPEVNAAATMMLITTLLVVTVGLLFYRRVGKGQKDVAPTDFMQL
jgi:spermidine/putrescine transport system permease protein